MFMTLTKYGRFLEYTRFVIRSAAILSPVFKQLFDNEQELFTDNSLESTKVTMYQTVVDMIKLVMTGSRNQINLQNVNRQSLMNSILMEVGSGQTVNCSV